MPKAVEVVCVFNRVHGFWGRKSCFSGKLQREKLLLCRGRTCAARSCKVNGHLREGRGPGACRRTTSADSLQANTLVRLFAPQGQTLLAPQFRCAQLWPHAHNPAPRRNSGSFLWFFLLLPKERTSSWEAAVNGFTSFSTPCQTR